MYFDGYGYNFYYGNYGYYEYSILPFNYVPYYVAGVVSFCCIAIGIYLFFKHGIDRSEKLEEVSEIYSEPDQFHGNADNKIDLRTIEPADPIDMKNVSEFKSVGYLVN